MQTAHQNYIDSRAYAIARLLSDQKGLDMTTVWSDVWLYQGKADVLRMIVGARLYNKAT